VGRLKHHVRPLLDRLEALAQILPRAIGNPRVGDKVKLTVLIVLRDDDDEFVGVDLLCATRLYTQQLGGRDGREEKQQSSERVFHVDTTAEDYRTTVVDSQALTCSSLRTSQISPNNSCCSAATLLALISSKMARNNPSNRPRE